MKICTYCKSEIEDSCLQCPNCGASEFEHKCPVCGCSQKGGACPECTMQAVSEAVGSVAVLTGRMKDMLSKIETNGGVENSKAENGETDPEMKGNGHGMIGGTRPSNPQPSNFRPSNPQPSNPRPSNPRPSNPRPSNLQPSNPHPSGIRPERKKISLFARIIRYILLGIFFYLLALVIITILIAVYIAITGNVPGFVMGLSG